MNINLSTKKSKLIILVSLFVVFVISGGYLLWRINQPETVAPDYTEASFDKDCTIYGSCYIVMGDCVGTCSDKETWRYCDSCGGGTDPSSCNNRVASDVGKPVGTRCIGKGSYTYECGAWCYLSSNGPSCCSSPTPTYTLKYTASTGGEISGSASQSVKKGNSGTPVTAVAKAGYTFSKWSDGKTDASRTDTNIQGNITVNAEFTAKQYTVTYKADSNGSLTGKKNQTVNHGASTTSVTAVPNPTYFFAGWSDGESVNPRQDTDVKKDITVTATFSLSCGNGTCEVDENAQTCPSDCKAKCGDGYCTHDETVLTCPKDCKAKCGDGYCTHDETSVTCPEDCSAECGDGYCDPKTETAANCPADCASNCGDGACTHDETSATCPEDCGPGVAVVPETGIFDDVQDSVLVGFVLLFLGFTWRILGRGIYISVSFLGTLPRKLTIQFKDVKEDVRARQRIRLLQKREQNRKKFEKKVVKD